MRVIHSGETVPKNLPAADPLPKGAADPGTKTDQWITVDSKKDLRFTATGESTRCDVIPMYQIREQRYSIYWQNGNSKQRT
jgi:hypothetical protein